MRFIAIRTITVLLFLVVLAQWLWLLPPNPYPVPGEYTGGNFVNQMLMGAGYIFLAIPLVVAGEVKSRFTRWAGRIVLAGGIVYILNAVWMAYGHIS